MMNDFDTYALYGIKKRNLYPVRIKVILDAPVREDVLRTAAEKAIRRFPYYARRVMINDRNAYELIPCEKPVTVSKDDHIVELGTGETNDLLFAITYDGSSIYFNFSHTFCGGCGAMRWIKSTLWYYLTGLGHTIDSSGIMTLDTPVTPEEYKEPDAASLPTDPPIGNLDFPTDSFTLNADYMEFMRDPDGVVGFYPVRIPKKELMKYARDNDGSPNSIISAVLFRMFTGLFPDQRKFSVKIACNYRDDVGCPETYRDLVRLMQITYPYKMKDWPIEKISTATRSQMYIQMQPEISWQEYRQVDAFRKGIDAQTDLDGKENYAFENGPATHGIPSTAVISYVGRVEWGGLAPFLRGIYSLTLGHVMLEINATEKDFCISFQTVYQHEKYLKAFLRTLDEEGLSCAVGDFEERRLPKIILP